MRYYLADINELFVMHVFDSMEEAKKCLKESYNNHPDLFIYSK
jgi:hypothetical protein